MRTHRPSSLRGTAVLSSTIAVLLWGFVGLADATPHPGQSLNVSIVSSPVVINGGDLPTVGADYAAFNFFNTPVASLNLTDLQNGTICGGAACDTVVLNVASSGMGCTTATLTAAQKTDLNTFVQNGGKLIIYDSECSAVDYSWLTFPFTTVNPGALGATGTLTIEADSILANSNPADPDFIDANVIATTTDAVGDMNVVTTQNLNWCASLTGTNAIAASGPTNMYGISGTGLFIYNGMDVDFLNGNTAVGPSGPGQFAKLWLQELQAVANLLPSAQQGCKLVVGIPLKIVMSAAFTLRQWAPGVKDDRLVEVGEFQLPLGSSIDPANEQVVVQLSEAACGGTFSTLTVPPGSFVKYQGGRVHLFNGPVTDAITAEVVQTSIRIARKADDIYTVALDLRDADFTCLEGSTNLKVETVVDIGGDVAVGEACFARLRSGDLYFPVKGATCP